jgi:23S rRNA pseudouridine1911/1915/1917 synthase
LPGTCTVSQTFLAVIARIHAASNDGAALRRTASATILTNVYMTAGDQNTAGECFAFEIDRDAVGQRLDAFLARMSLRPAMTRSMLQQLIRDGFVTVCSQVRKSGYRLQEGDLVEVLLPPSRPSALTPEEIEFRILYEDDELVVVSKPPGLVVHPACGNETGTLVHGLLFRCGNLAGISGEQRPGIVHRLDKDTSGVMVIAKNDRAHQALATQFKDRRVEKIYRALVNGRLAEEGGRIVAPIGRHPVQRQKMAVLPAGGREAVTNWRVLERFTANTYLEIRLETGRTHQIRVHLAHLGHPITGDPVYGGKIKGGEDLKINRQCLHAFRLSFTHPLTGEWLAFQAPVWPDMEEILRYLREKAAWE